MTKQKLTPWYPSDIKPVRKGTYERVWLAESGRNGIPWMRYWNGTHWEGDGNSEGVVQYGIHWRGIAK